MMESVFKKRIKLIKLNLSQKQVHRCMKLLYDFFFVSATKQRIAVFGFQIIPEFPFITAEYFLSPAPFFHLPTSRRLLLISR